MAQLREVAGGETSAFGVFRGNAVGRDAFYVAVQEDDGETFFGKMFRGFGGQFPRREDGAVQGVAKQEGEDVLAGLLVVGALLEEDRSVAVLSELGVKGVQLLREEGVAHVSDHDANGVGAVRDQGSGGDVGEVAEAAGGLDHALAGALGDPGVPPERPRDRRLGDVRLPRYVLAGNAQSPPREVPTAEAESTALGGNRVVASLLLGGSREALACGSPGEWGVGKSNTTP